MKQQSLTQGISSHGASERRTAQLSSRTFYRPDSHCSELGAWYFLTEELGEVGPFDSREQAREAMALAQALDSCPQKIKKKRAVH